MNFIRCSGTPVRVYNISRYFFGEIMRRLYPIAVVTLWGAAHVFAQAPVI
jgi:hypothetical protein